MLIPRLFSKDSQDFRSDLPWEDSVVYQGDRMSQMSPTFSIGWTSKKPCLRRDFFGPRIELCFKHVAALMCFLLAQSEDLASMCVQRLYTISELDC